MFGILLAIAIGLFIGATVATVDYNNCNFDCADKQTAVIVLWSIWWIPFALAFVPFCYFCCCSADPLQRAATSAAVVRIRSSNHEGALSPTEDFSKPSARVIQEGFVTEQTGNNSC